MDLQSALQRIAPHITPPQPETPPRPAKRAARPVARPAGPRLVAVGTFDCGRKAFDTTGAFDRPDLSTPVTSLTFKWSPT